MFGGGRFAAGLDEFVRNFRNTFNGLIFVRGNKAEDVPIGIKVVFHVAEIHVQNVLTDDGIDIDGMGFFGNVTDSILEFFIFADTFKIIAFR